MMVVWPLVTPLVVSALQFLGAFCFYSRGFHDAAALSELAEGRSWPAAWTWASAGDMALLNVVTALLTAAAALAAYACAVSCVRCGRRAVSAYTVAVVYGLLSFFPLAKVTAAPAEDDWFWLQAITLFAAATVNAFALTGVLSQVYGWAALRVAERYLGVGWRAKAAKEAAAAKAAAKAAADAAVARGAADKAGDKPGAAAPAGKKKNGLMRLLSLSWPDRHYVAAAFLCLLLAAVGSTFLPQLVGNTIECVGLPSGSDEDPPPPSLPSHSLPISLLSLSHALPPTPARTAAPWPSTTTLPSSISRSCCSCLPRF